MSYDIDIQIDTGTGDLHTIEEVGNYTSNLAGMWWDAFGYSFADLDGRSCSEAAPLIAAALVKMRDPANFEKYKAMEPSNGWGDMDSAIDFVQKTHDACLRHPRGQLRISN